MPVAFDWEPLENSRAEDIDRNRALAAKHRAEERLRQKQSQHEYIQTQAALARALARLKAKPGK